MLLRTKRGRAACVIALVGALFSTQATAFGLGTGSQPVVLISNNSGGNIAAFAADAAGYRDSGTHVQFAGRCDSACTLFLGLPSQQICVAPGAYFRFHSPSGASARSEHVAQNYLMRKYPGWVRAWIGRNHGLSHQLITMNYDYASQHIKTCATFASR
jgi:hypothetical protein